MYRLAIIDDEQATRRGLRELLDWEGMRIRIVGEAEDGLSGKALIAREKPDILICDVRMPKLDGIALVAQIRPLFPDLQIIFLSGHSEKAYLKSAIRFGAVDYLDKPVMKEELAHVVEKALQRVRDAKGGLPMQAFQSLMAQRLTTSGEAMPLALPAHLPVSFDKPYQVAVFVFRPPDGESESSGLFLQQHQRAFAEILGNHCAGKALLHVLGNQYVAYFNPPDTFACEELANAYALSLAGLWPKTALCLSSLHRDAEELPLAYQEAQEANRSFFMGFGRTFSFQPHFSFGDYVSFAGSMEKIMRQVETRSFSRAAEMLDSHILKLSRCAARDTQAIRKDLARLAVFLARQYHPEEESYQFATLERVKYNSHCLEDIRIHLQDILAHIVSSLDNLSEKGRVIFDVERYIQANYDKDLTISDIAGQVYLTPTYLCYLFKKNTGQTLNAYITKVKMEKARELLRDHSLKLSDIARMLGYHSAHYFTRLFAKQWGASPTVYRNQNL